MTGNMLHDMTPKSETPHLLRASGTQSMIEGGQTHSRRQRSVMRPHLWPRNRFWAASKSSIFCVSLVVLSFASASKPCDSDHAR